MNEICEFRGANYYLSNFYEIPVTYEGITYQNNEAAFQAQKCLNPKDRIQFAGMNATEAKKLGRSVALRPDWERVKTSIMRDVVHAKFSQHPELAEKLMATGNAYLAEGNTWHDRVWGIDENRNGANLLGAYFLRTAESAGRWIKKSERKRKGPLGSFFLCGQKRGRSRPYHKITIVSSSKVHYRSNFPPPNQTYLC